MRSGNDVDDHPFCFPAHFFVVVVVVVVVIKRETTSQTESDVGSCLGCEDKESLLKETRLQRVTFNTKNCVNFLSDCLSIYISSITLTQFICLFAVIANMTA